jgi:hypothetical protein
MCERCKALHHHACACGVHWYCTDPTHHVSDRLEPDDYWQTCVSCEVAA